MLKPTSFKSPYEGIKNDHTLGLYVIGTSRYYFLLYLWSDRLSAIRFHTLTHKWWIDTL